MLHPQSSGGTRDRFEATGHPKCRCEADRFAALPDIDDAVATQPVQVPLPTWVDDVPQEEYPRQRRRLQLISQSSRVSGADAALHADVAEDEMRVAADHDSESDTESVPGIDRRIGRRLSPQWRADPDARQSRQEVPPREKSNAVGAAARAVQ